MSMIRKMHQILLYGNTGMRMTERYTGKAGLRKAGRDGILNAVQCQ